MNRQSEVEVEPTSINIFDIKNSAKLETPAKPEMVSTYNDTALMGQTLNKFKWNKDYLNEPPAKEEFFDSRGLARVDYDHTVAVTKLDNARMKEML